jgi:hypothetical protein
MNIGEVYFIGERDRSTGKLTENVKIGMVGAKGDSGDRLKQHQTGNPRDLVLHHVVETPAPFWVENGLHQRLNGLRVRAEWHKLDPKGLEEAIRLAEVLATESFVHIPFMENQEYLRTCLSDGTKRDPSEDSTMWHERLNRAKAQLDRIEELKAAYSSIIDTMSPAEIEQAELEDIILLEYYTDVKFDLDGFTAKYPELISKYTISETKIGGNITPKYSDLQISEIDPGLETFHNTFLSLCNKVSRKESVIADMSELQAELQFRENVISWERKISTAHLASICGLASGISGQLTWNRTAKTKSSLDKEALESNHPKEFGEFVTAEMKSRKKNRKRARRVAVAND